MPEPIHFTFPNYIGDSNDLIAAIRQELRMTKPTLRQRLRLIRRAITP